MTCQDIWKKYSKRIGQIVCSQRELQSIYDIQLKNAIEIKKRYEENENLHGIPVSCHNMSFIDPISKGRIFYNFEQISTDEIIIRLVIQRNRNFQFLLMEAYEVFEDAVEELYALIGMNDLNFWPLKNIKGISKEELAKKDFAFFLNRSANLKGGTISITAQLLKYFNINASIDGIPLIQHIVFIEKLRHIIVHKRGRVKNIEAFIDKVAKDCGVYNNGKIPDKLRAFIGFYIGTEKSDNLIVLDPYEISNPFSLRMTHNRFEGLIESLMGCIYLLAINVNKYLSLLYKNRLPAIPAH